MIDFINNLTLAYPNVHDCLESNNKNIFWVGEDAITRKSFIVNDVELEEKEALLEIKNPHTKDINLLCVDGCLFSSSDSSRCDCALFDDDKFCYCELKYDVQNMGTASKNLQKARNLQLSNTISSFSSKIDFSLFSKIEAYVVLKKRLYPNRPARLSELKTAFWDKHKVEYFEDKEIIFDAPIKKKVETYSVKKKWRLCSAYTKKPCKKMLK